MHGKGIYTFSNGEIYEGDFVIGKRHGKGKSTWLDGTTYEGDFANNEFHGKGKYIASNGEVYEGYWINGKPHEKEINEGAVDRILNKLIFEKSPTLILESKNSISANILQNKLMDSIIERRKEINKFEEFMVGKTVDQCYDIFNNMGIKLDIRVVENERRGLKDNTIDVYVYNNTKNVVRRVSKIGKIIV
jgi:hypothetical protein